MISIKAIIEVAGFPKEHIEETMVKVVEKLKQESKVTKHEVFEAVELKDKLEGFWSTFCDIEMNFNNIEELIRFCFEYMPSSIEILNPEKLNFNNIEVANVLNDLLARLHHYDMLVKNLNASNQVMKKKLDQANVS